MDSFSSVAFDAWLPGNNSEDLCSEGQSDFFSDILNMNS